MTEDEAKTKACCGPWAVNWSGRSGVIGLAGRAQTCLASACMAWRWDHDDDLPRGLEPLPTPTQGHCGLAGSVWI